MTLQVELVADARCEIAEGPLWHPDERCLYWTDVPAGKVHRFDPRDRSHHVVYVGAPVGGMTIQADGSLLFLGEAGKVCVWRDGAVPRTILAGIPAEAHTRFNDVIADPLGRVFGGTMAQRNMAGEIVRYGRLLRLDRDGTVQPVLDGVGSPNGMGFTADHRRLFFTDSIVGTQAIFSFDYDMESGALRNPTVVHQTPLDGCDGRPDGMTIDIEDCIWSARWDAGVVVRIDLDGTELERYQIPVSRVTSLAFGGPDYTDLYVTTARTAGREDQEPSAGGIFRLRTGTAGRPEHRSRIRL